jgi:hypothetical protein
MTIQDAVLTSLGHPPGLYRVVVRLLWLDHYRVNVMVGPDASSVRIPHSYFVAVGADSVIRSCVPRIVRLY